EVFTSPLSYGVQPFTVSRAQRTNRITLEVPELVRPGTPLTIGYHSQSPGKIVIFAVDEGILQVAQYQTPDPLGHFFRKRALQVTTSQILDQILPEYRLASEMAAPGGGEDADAIGKNLNPFRRKRDKPVAYWSGIIDVDSTPRELRYEVPDYFAGTLRVMAVAVSDATLGASEQRLLARGPFVLTPNVPTFAAPGDTFTVSVTVANGVEESGKEAKVDIDLATSSHLEVVGAASQSLPIGEGREQTTTFQVKAKEQLGSGRLTFAAKLGKESSSRSIELSVRPPVPFMTSVNSGHLTDDKVEVPAPRVMFPQFRTREVAASTLPLGLARGLVSYLNSYPYGCTEQLVSQAFPAIVLRDRPEFGYSPAKVESNLQGALRILRARQNADGAFGFWAANSHVSDMQSAYAVHFLTEAKERGLAVPDDLLENALRYMTTLAGRDPDNLAEARASSYAIYLLTRNGTVTTRYLDGLRKRLDAMAKEQWHHDLSGLLLAATYRMLKLERDADKLLAGVRFGEAQQVDYATMYDGLVRDALFLNLLARHFPERLPKVEGDDLLQIAKPIMQGNFNTLSSAYTILALDAYAGAVGTPQQAQLKFEALLAKEKLQPLAVPAGLFPQVALGDEARGVRISVEGKKPLFYQLTEAGFDRQPPQQAIKQRLEVQREYRNSNGDVVSKAALGEELEVHVKVRAVGNEYLSNIAVVDLLPGGFEPVLERIAANTASEQEGYEGEEYDAEGDYEEGDYEEGDYEEGEGYEEPVNNGDWTPDYVDLREDRVVIFGSVGPEVQEFVYRMRATNRGRFEVPPPFAEAMYDRTVQARGTMSTIEISAP
ncbi:MAG TPA: alpha-2-macroglobulin family protein, partial [Gammaproteobacteria bacterium]